VTTDHDPIEAEAYRPIVETERAADRWLAEALRKLARDEDVIARARHRILRKDQMVTVTSVLAAVAAVLEADG
jgi:hypothetical protein